MGAFHKMNAHMHKYTHNLADYLWGWIKEYWSWGMNILKRIIKLF